MLPLDEVPVEVDANNRALKVPAAFVKCASVQNDHIAETIMFTTDRYYDFMDLATTEIYVQWSSADDQGATKIELIDLSVPNKIRFGWPLTKTITKTPGRVEFSVRFFRQDATDVLYSFNTLSNEILIKSALQPDINAEAEVEKPVAQSYFINAIVSSQLTGSGEPNPLNPTFEAPGLNLPATSALDENNSLTMKVQAVVGDTGTMTYTWYHKPADATDFVEIPSIIAMEKILPQPTERIKYEEYYVQSKTDAEAYELYAGQIPHPEGVELWEKYSAYTVPTTGNVTGAYKVSVVNTLGQNTTVNPTWSQECILPSPADIEFVKDLEQNIMFAQGQTNMDLGVEIAKDINNSTITYTWQGSSESAEAMTEITDAHNKSYNISNPGWYRVDIKSNLNREDKFAHSTVCKVSAYPEVPTVSIIANVADEEGIINVEPGATVEFTVAAGISEKENVANELYKGNLEYVWMVNAPDTNGFVELTHAFPTAGMPVVISGLDTNKLIVRNVDNTAAYSYQCLVKHIFNEVEVSTTTDTFTIV